MAAERPPTLTTSAIFHRPWAKTINVFRACLGAQLTICAQKWRNFILFSTVSLRFLLSRVCVFLYSLGPMIGVHIQPLGPEFVFGDITRAVVIIKRGQQDNLVGSTIGACRVAINVSTLALRTWKSFSLASYLSTGAFFGVVCHYDINTTGDESNGVLTTRYGSNVRDGVKVTRDFPRHVYRVP